MHEWLLGGLLNSMKKSVLCFIPYPFPLLVSHILCRRPTEMHEGKRGEIPFFFSLNLVKGFLIAHSVKIPF